MGLFRFIGIEIDRVNASFPSDINGFVFGMKAVKGFIKFVVLSYSTPSPGGQMF